jgi:hypothetical protein
MQSNSASAIAFRDKPFLVPASLGIMTVTGAMRDSKNSIIFIVLGPRKVSDPTVLNGSACLPRLGNLYPPVTNVTLFPA